MAKETHPMQMLSVIVILDYSENMIRIQSVVQSLFFPSIFHLWMIVCGYRGLNRMYNISLSKLPWESKLICTSTYKFNFLPRVSVLYKLSCD